MWQFCQLSADARFECSRDQGVATVHEDVQGVSVGLNHVCLYYTDGELRCQGDYQQFPRRMPWDFPKWSPAWQFDSEIVQMDSSDYSVCAVTRLGSLWCWGNNWHGQLGPGPTPAPGAPHFFLDPTRVALQFRVRKVATGPSETCVIAYNRDVYCWGFGESGVLGVPEDGPFLPREFDSVLTPKRVPFVSNIVDLDVGGSACAPHVCAVDADGRLTCWGSDGARSPGHFDFESGVCLEGAATSLLEGLPQGFDAGYSCSRGSSVPGWASRTAPCHPGTPFGHNASDRKIDWSKMEGQHVTVSGIFCSGCMEYYKEEGTGCADFLITIGGSLRLRDGPALPCSYGSHAGECRLQSLTLVTVGGKVTVSSMNGSLAWVSPVVLNVDWICRRE